MGAGVLTGHEMSEKELRAQFCETLISMAAEDERLVLLDADLMNAAGTKPFRARFPERTFDCGVEEANMIGTAAGLSSRGFIPFAHTFAPFAARHACDQIFMSCAYAGLNVKIIGSDPGITAALNGGTHMSFEDLGIMSTIPEITVAEPCDLVSLDRVMRLAKESYGTWYIRLHRKNAPVIYNEETEFETGKAKVLRSGEDATVIAMGLLVDEALKAAENLAPEGISVRVLDMWCLKPLDSRAVICAAQETGAIVTAENHNTINGLGSAVARTLSLNCPIPLEMVGIDDEFGQVGDVSWLKEHYCLTADAIEAKVHKVLGRKLHSC